VKSLHLQKIWRIYKILAFTENQAGDRILAGVEIPPPGKKPASAEKPAGLEKLAARFLGSVESPAADFLLVWLKSSLSDPRRCDEYRMQSPSEETAQAALLLWAALSRTVPAAMPRNEQNPHRNQKVRRPLGISLIPAKSQKSYLGF
jgi:hypothetical protein